ncbi:family 10 glycosylhydrolase [Arenibacter sp. GZD96]|uniref:glycoside hydrolase family 10 protein n=1 Tax=Aurantibrevibacter litoralis TaxID=3106030 RepID=UPI002AFEB4B7|nr:family 10 glycosylhydrolase [Arenibacter sp. GZD-96]MEA1785056.1 family 10 glycosylhydrolase [Arenibacter sp. GZD-96]
MFKKTGLLLLLLSTSCTVFQSGIPQPRSEFRGVWIATVANIDWPKSSTDGIEKQKADFIDILDFYADLNFNAAIVQIRTAGDAFYKTELAPWSRFLTGAEGKSPETNEDLLRWMIRETHNRGMEFHAWLNPYRATMNENTAILSPTHDFFQHPDWMLKYGAKYYYNPGLPEVQHHLTTIMEEVVAKYDVDAIHFDDYFYPYKIKDEVLADTATYTAHALPHQSIADWRRSNVDSLVKNVHKVIKARKPWVQFGISPFGVWKNKSTDPKGSDTQAGQTTYEDLYADPLLWMEKGWIDYLVPQAYWSMDLPVASHRKIVDWWTKNRYETNLYIGNGAYKIRNNSDLAWHRKKELPEQIKWARQKKSVQGNVYFSAKSLMQNNADVVAYLKRKYYKTPALPPASPYVPAIPAQKPSLLSLTKASDSVTLTFSGIQSYRHALIFLSGKKGKTEYPMQKLRVKKSIGTQNSISLASHEIKNKNYIALTFIDKFGLETEPLVLSLKQPIHNDSKR